MIRINTEGFELYKYFKGESTNPFRNKNKTAALWWDGEKSFYDRIKNEHDFLNSFSLKLKDAIKSNAVSGILTDESVDFNKRLLIFYLDLWHSKWFPYDDLNLIYEY